ncbi:MAG TPA: hypothetical protein PLV68_04565, partial [Ilumatobacteraceae bacterium]|nr:hypothetical protein [Ilumatobacteraceae bacterium]
MSISLTVGNIINITVTADDDLPITGMLGTPNGKDPDTTDDFVPRGGDVSVPVALVRQHSTDFYEFTDSWRVLD